MCHLDGARRAWFVEIVNQIVTCVRCAGPPWVGVAQLLIPHGEDRPLIDYASVSQRAALDAVRVDREGPDQRRFALSSDLLDSSSISSR